MIATHPSIIDLMLGVVEQKELVIVAALGTQPTFENLDQAVIFDLSNPAEV